jgi:hypothetical protein
MAKSLDSHRVGIVVDRDFGSHIVDLARSMHLWVVDSAANRPAIDAARRSGGIAPTADPSGTAADPMGPGVTSFAAPDAASPEQVCL